MDHPTTTHILLHPEGSAAGCNLPDEPANTIKVSYTPEQTLSAAIYLSGLFAPPVLCSGIALCKRCRIRSLNEELPITPSDTQAFTPEELSEGWRLACRHKPLPGLLVALPFHVPVAGEDVRRKREAASASQPHGSCFTDATVKTGTDVPQEYSLAVDLGTTSLQWQLLAVSSGTITDVLWEGSAVNPQMGAGSDVVSRLSTASTPSGLRSLSRITVDALRNITENADALVREQAPSSSVQSMCLAANTAMTAIALGKDVSSLASAPYSLPYAGAVWEELPGLPKLWIPPQLSPFVGGDIATGYAALALTGERPEYPFLLADMGTNGEFLLALSPDTAFAASVALGPALEGSGLSFGTEARPGAITGFSLTPAGLEAHFLNNAYIGKNSMEPSGITGTGYISLLHVLLQSGLVQRDGRFIPGTGNPMARFCSFGSDPLRYGEAFLNLPHGFRLYASDVEELLKVKAAFSLGLQMLLEQCGIAAGGLARICIAGSLGEHVNKAALENLGFFPPGCSTKVDAVGNTSLKGAALLVTDEQTRESLVAWAHGVSTLDLAADPKFSAQFPSHMRFSWL